MRKFILCYFPKGSFPEKEMMNLSMRKGKNEDGHVIKNEFVLLLLRSQLDLQFKYHKTRFSALRD